MKAVSQEPKLPDFGSFCARLGRRRINLGNMLSMAVGTWAT
jgi:hypothetical protein